MALLIRLLGMALALAAAPVHAQPSPDPHTDLAPGKPRLFVLTDIGNEPDDQMSVVRLLLYANEIDIEGLVATTSTWQKTKTNEHTIRELIAAYAKVRPNLLKHAKGWPEASRLDALVSAGQPGYGMGAVGPDKMSAGARALLAAMRKPDPRPLWVALWGGGNTLAQALSELRRSYYPEGVEAAIARLRVYSISDQDDAGAWIRREFPKLSYIVSPSAQDGADYSAATWTGISGDIYYRNGDGGDSTTVTNEWLDTHIRAKGPLGAHYPRFAFIMEGDTPSILGLIGNGLEAFRNPSWGGWSGRYLLRQSHGETRPIWTQGGDSFARIDSRDAVTGADGRVHVSDQATIWRWRSAFQHDFAARMDWTVKPFAAANHPPAVLIEGQAAEGPIFLDAQVGRPLRLDAGATRDPDGGRALRFAWYHYPEAGFATDRAMANVAIEGADSARATITPSAVCRPVWLPRQTPCAQGTAHVILAVTDDGGPNGLPLTRYRRIILTVRAAPE